MPLFTLQALGDQVCVVVDSATALQAQAFADRIAKTREFGPFRDLLTPGAGYASMTLCFAAELAEPLQAFLTTLAAADLAEDINAIEVAQTKVAAAKTESTRIASMSVAEFLQELQTRSGNKLFGRLVQGASRFSPVSIVELRAADLMPVTHFKALARLTTYVWKTKTFKVHIEELGGQKRESLLGFVDELKRSTKKVTAADIAARKAERNSRTAANSGGYDMDFTEAMEDFGVERAKQWYREGKLSDSPGKPDHASYGAPW